MPYRGNASLRYNGIRLNTVCPKFLRRSCIVINCLVEYRMRENPTFIIVQVDMMSATCRLTLYLLLAVSQTKLHARNWLTVIQLQYRLPIQ